MISRARILTASALIGVIASCGGSSDPVPLVWVGKGGAHLPASTAASVFWVQADVNGVPGPQVIVDTGAPFALLNVEAFQGAVALGKGSVATMTLGNTVLWKVPTVGVHAAPDHSDSIAPNGKPFGGILGFSVFGQFPMSFNYRDQQVVVGGAAPPAEVLPVISIPFSLEGGGVGELPENAGALSFSPSRIILQATIEGTPRTFLLDTGASWVALRTVLFQSLAADGRGQVTDDASLASGNATTKVMRLRSVAVQGIDVKDAVAAAGTKVDDLIDNLVIEVGHPVDGLLGAPFLREFYVTIDYPNHKLDLYRYASEAHIHDEYRRVGLDLAGQLTSTGAAYFVHHVYPGTDADKKGIVVGEQVLLIDGAVLQSLDIVSVDQKLLGEIGATHTLGFNDKTVDVLVEDLLPLP
jgi:predicted aspartyl protease